MPDAESDWFALAARAVLVHKIGTALHYITGFDERICQRYAAGTVRPPAYFLRAILRSEQGEPFLAQLMAGSNAAWWRRLQADRRLASAMQPFIVEITKRE